jgi:UDP-N-acetylmuramate: L-alanyl-gamma-D-glutamyl-meso-diaminopimelate ligase
VTELVKDKQTVIANMDDPGIRKVIESLGLADQVTRVATLGETKGCQVRVGRFEAKAVSAGEQEWTVDVETDHLGTVRIQTGLSGKHNLANIAMVVACLISLDKAGDLAKKLDKNSIVKAIKSFQNVKRRLDLLASAGGIDVYEDFAHHPTAIRLVIEGFKQVFPKKRLIVAFEPRSASQRRNVFQKAFGESLALADRVMIGECPVDQRIPEDKRMNTGEMASAIGSKAFAFPTNDALLGRLKAELTPGDAVIFMSSGSFSGAQHALAKDLRSRFG